MADGSTSVRWYSAVQLVALPGMPSTHSAIVRMAKREAWPSRPRSGRGGGLEYAESSLPEITRIELQRRAAIAAANAINASPDYQAGTTISRRLALTQTVDEEVRWRRVQAGAAKAAALTGAARDRMNAKLDLLARVDEFAQHHALGICAAREAFCAAIRNGEVVVTDNVIRAIGCDVSPASIGRWQRMLATQGAAALAGEYGNRKGSGLIERDDDLKQFVLAMLVDQSHVGPKTIHRGLQARFHARGKAIPQLRSLCRFINAWKRDNAQLLLATQNPDAWKNRHMVAFGSASEDITRLNQRWEFDSTPADVQLVDGRYTIIGVIDIWSRRGLLYVAKTSCSAGVCEAIRRAILSWGVPEEAKIDNGQDYVSERVQRVFSSLGVNAKRSEKFSPWQKPHIERFFNTFSHSLLELLPGYSGHNVADAQALRASKSFAERLFTKNSTIELKLSADELQRFCDRWCESLYLHEEHAGLGMMRPFERIASWRGEVRRISDERVLDLLLAEAPDGTGGRTVTKKGLRVDGYLYAAPELTAHVGERVRVLYDERDIGRIVVYRDEDFLCIAECPEIEGISRAELAAASKQIQKREIESARTQLRAAARKQKTADVLEEILQQKEREAAALAALPLAENVLHVTPAIEAARAALEAKTSFEKDVDREYFIAAQQAITNLRAPQLEEETGEQRFQWALDELLKEPSERTEFDMRRLRAYRDTSEFGGRWIVFQGFGRSAFPFLNARYDALLEDGALAHRYRELELQWGQNL